MKYLISVIILLSNIFAYTQQVIEIKFINEKWHIELFNRNSMEIESLKICNGTDTASINSSVVGSLNTGVIVVITTDSLSRDVNFEVAEDYGCLIINDTIFDHFEWYSNFMKEDYSWVYLDSLELQKYKLPGNFLGNGCSDDDYYAGIALSSLGDENHIEDCFSRIEGRLNRGATTTPLHNILFTSLGIWTSQFGDTIQTDSDGNFSATTLAWNCTYSYS